MKKTKPKKLLTVLLTLYLALSIVPITVFADSGSYAVKFYPGDYGTMTKNDQIPFVYYGFDDDVNKPYYYKLNVSETETLSFASSIINVLLPNSDYEFAYWKADATVYQVGSGTAIPAGTALSSDQLQNKITVKSDVTFTAHFKQISEYSDDSVITSAAVQNVKFNYQPGDAPQATAEVYNADADKYEIAYECWQEYENNEPVAAWYSDNDSHGSLPKITEFESGKKYVYFLMLKPKDGYSFNSETTVTVNGESVKSSLSGEYLYVPTVKTITPTKQNTVITSAAVENVKLDYKDGETPRTTATAAAADRDKYDILYECWGKLEKTDEYTTKSVAYWYSDEDYCPSGYADLTSFNKDGKYKYSVRLEAKDGYIFSDSISADDITLNGKSLPEGSFVMTLDDNRTCVVTYGMNMRTVRPLDTVKLYGATTEFYIDGDSPRFNGYSYSAYSDVAYEKWEDKDDRSIGINSDESLNGGYSQLVDSFKYGKTYIYGVAFNIADLGLEQGYRFDENTKLYINDKEVTLNPNQVQVSDDGMSVWFNDILSMTPEAPWQKIDLVEIDGATIDFKAGDKPVFTGIVPENSPNVLPQCEFWEGDDGSGVNSYWFWDQNYKNHIDAFESGKTYTYGVYVKAAHGYYFTQETKLKINGKFYNYHLPEGDPELDNPDFMATLWAVTDLTITPDGSVPHSHNYGTEWKHDETNHWHECECGNKADITAHTFKQIIDKEATATEKGSKHEECTVCGYKKTAVDIPKIDPHNHNYGTEWKHDETNHWHECEDGEKADITAHNFKWIIDKEATATEKGSKHEECTVCGYKKTAVDIPVTDFRSSSDDEANKPTNTVSSESSSADQTNKPINTASPKTGNTDNMILWIVLLVIGGGVFITATAVDRKKK